jgi:DnaJ-domain-containing protein 1
VHKAFGALPSEKARELERDLTALLERNNRARGRALVVPSEYLEVVVAKA